MVQKSRTNLGARNEQFLDETSKLERKVQVESRMILLPDEEDEGREWSLLFENCSNVPARKLYGICSYEYG
jgi:hypothetical protein